LKYRIDGWFGRDSVTNALRCSSRWAENLKHNESRQLIFHNSRTEDCTYCPSWSRTAHKD
jgi:hypothetical protein